MELAPRLKVVYWEEVTRWRRLPYGSYVFTDLEHLGPAMTAFACHVAERLVTVAEPRKVRIINDPRRVKLRYTVIGAVGDHECAEAGAAAVQ